MPSPNFPNDPPGLNRVKTIEYSYSACSNMSAPISIISLEDNAIPTNDFSSFVAVNAIAKFSLPLSKKSKAISLRFAKTAQMKRSLHGVFIGSVSKNRVI